MPAALLVASTRSHADARETLRIQDVAGVLVDAGWKVDLLVPRPSALLTATLSADVRVVPVPRLPLSSMPPRRPSVRRFLVGAMMFLRGTALVSRNGYSIVHGFNDGALVARAIDRATLSRFPYIADFTDPFGVRGLYRGFRAAVARHFEHAAMRHAAAVIIADAETPPMLVRKVPPARVSVIPDPHAEIAPEAFTRAEFAEALARIYAYATREDRYPQGK